jgi:DNA-binding CsgD family transcriptional regulator
MEYNSDFTVSVAIKDLPQLTALTIFLKENNMDLIGISKKETTPTVSSFKDHFSSSKYTKSNFGRYGFRILQLLAEGKTYEEIADITQITIDGVRYYIKKIYKVLEVKNARAAIHAYQELKTAM